VSDGNIDSILIVSFGGPEKPDDVLPFLRNVTKGRNIPDDRLAEVGEHYMDFGGRSPINDQARALIEALRDELVKSSLDLPIYWGNRNWDPFLADTLREMEADGRRQAIAFVTSAYSSYSGCRQYREDIERARLEVGVGAPNVEKIRQFYNHPGFIEPMVRNTKAALDLLPEEGRAGARVVFTAHSIPQTMGDTSRYEAQLREVAELIVERLDDPHRWDVVYQSRSGPPSVPWLGPDICDHLETLHADGFDGVVMVPIGFVSDHMEVIYDLDTEAMAKAAELGMSVTRAATVGIDPQFVRAIRELIVERLDGSAMRSALGLTGPVGCLGEHCCPPPSRA